MMRGQASDNILTLMASIDRLHSQATDSDLRQAPHQNRASQSPQPPENSAVADREVIHLNALFASPLHGQSQPAGQTTEQGQRQGQKSTTSRRWSPTASKDSNDDFDAKLAKLIEDVVGAEPAGEPAAFENRGPIQTHPRADGRKDGRVDGQGGARRTPYLEASKAQDTRDIRSEIDYLLAPYLEKTGPATLADSAVVQRPERRPERRVENRPENRPENRTEQMKAKAHPLDQQLPPQFAQKGVNAAPEPHIRHETLKALLSPADLLELNDFIKQEIKNQISVWITQNIDKIIEDSLLSARSEARNATDSARETVNRSG